MSKKSFPIGIIIILYLTGLATVLHVIGVKNPLIAIGTIEITGVLAKGYNIALALLAGATFYGIFKRKTWGRILGIVRYVVTLLIYSTIHITSILNVEEIQHSIQKQSIQYPEYLTENVLIASQSISLIAAWVIISTIIVYLYRNKNFFKN